MSEEDKKEQVAGEKPEGVAEAVVAEDKADGVPDYDITEDKGEPPEADERLGKNEDDAPPAEKAGLSNREKRQLRKKKLAEKFDAKNSLIRKQQEMINQLAGRINDVDGRLSQVDQAQLQQAWNETTAVFEAAEREHADAFKTQDGPKATLAMRKMYEAQKRLDELQAVNTRMQARQAAPQAQPDRPDPRVQSKATEWAARNQWFDPKAGDDDSAIANTIATKLVKEGYDAGSEEYWEELDQRLTARGINASGEDDDDEPKPQRRSPPVNGSSGRGDLSGKTSITLPTAYINNLKEAGLWDDQTKRNKMIKRYLDGLKDRSSEGRR